MNFCGSSGEDPLREGLTELKTIELAKKRNILTSGCGYPKEIDIILRLQNIFRLETINKITFASSNCMISEILLHDCGPDEENLYFSVRTKMQERFGKYMKQNYVGKLAHLKKAKSYEQLEYMEVYLLLEKYEKNRELKNMIVEGIQTKKGKK